MLPQIHEIIPVKRTEPTIDKVDDIKELVEEFADDDAFENGDAVHSLQLHLTAVKQYEKQEKTEKLVKHMKGFKTLLDYQKEHGLISDEAYEALHCASDTFIENSE